MHGALLWWQGTGHRQNPSPDGNMCRKTWWHNDAVITHLPTPHTTVIISSTSHPHPTSHEGHMHHVSRPAMWWGICNTIWCNPCLPTKRKTANPRHQISYIRIILHIILRTHPSTPFRKPHRPLPSPTSNQKWGRGLLCTPHDYQILFGAIFTSSSVEFSTLNLD